MSDVLSKEETPIKINQDANIHIVELDYSKSVSMEIREGRQAYLLCMEGSIDILGGINQQLVRHDGAEITGPMTLIISPTLLAQNLVAHILLVEMKFAGDGRKDL